MVPVSPAPACHASFIRLYMQQCLYDMWVLVFSLWDHRGFVMCKHIFLGRVCIIWLHLCYFWRCMREPAGDRLQTICAIISMQFGAVYCSVKLYDYCTLFGTLDRLMILSFLIWVWVHCVPRTVDIFLLSLLASLPVFFSFIFFPVMDISLKEKFAAPAAGRLLMSEFENVLKPDFLEVQLNWFWIIKSPPSFSPFQPHPWKDRETIFSYSRVVNS